MAYLISCVDVRLELPPTGLILVPGPVSAQKLGGIDAPPALGCIAIDHWRLQLTQPPPSLALYFPDPRGTLSLAPPHQHVDAPHALALLRTRP
jgi:hypothetical protein